MHSRSLIRQDWDEDPHSIGWAVPAVLRSFSDQQHPRHEIRECFEFVGTLFHIRSGQPDGNELFGVIIGFSPAVADEAIHMQCEMVLTEDRSSACARIRAADLFGRAKPRSQACYFHDFHRCVRWIAPHYYLSAFLSAMSFLTWSFCSFRISWSFSL
jgi:hypothetical protein